MGNGAPVTFTGKPATFTGQDSSITYDWDFGNGTQRTSTFAATYAYSNAGSYYVYVTINNAVSGPVKVGPVRRTIF